MQLFNEAQEEMARQDDHRLHVSKVLVHFFCEHHGCSTINVFGIVDSLFKKCIILSFPLRT